MKFWSALILVGILGFSAPATAAEFMLGLGLDTQLAQTDLDPQGSFTHPDSEAEIGWSIIFHTRFRLSERFGLRTGGEFVSRHLKQSYEDGFIFTSFDGETRYDVITVDIPLFFEFYLGNGNHTIFFGPKVAVSIYDHCNQEIQDFVEAKQCVPDAVNEVFAVFDAGYMLRLSEIFGLTFFAEYSVVPIVEGGGIESNLFRTGAIATFYF